MKEVSVLSSLRARVLATLGVLLLLLAARAEGVQVVGPGGHATIQAGINAAAPGETIEVAPGIYTENLTLTGKDVVLVATDGADATEVSGSSLGSVFHIASTAVTRGTVIQGFTFRDGLADAGGGLMIRDGARPTIQGNVIEGNRATVSGGGIKVSHGADPEIVGNVIRLNSSGANGAGIHVEGLVVPSTTASIRQNTIRDNEVDSHQTSSGGGVKVTFSTSSTLIEGNLILDNTVTWAGGGISIFAGSAVVRGNTISGNDGGRFAGGIHFEVDSGGARTLVLEGNTISGNGAVERGGGIHTQGLTTASTIEIRDNLIVENTALNPACVEVSCPASSCGKGGGLDAQRSTVQRVAGNEIRDNRADCYGAVLFSGSPLAATFTGNTVQGNSGTLNYPGVGCVDMNGCTVARNRFLGNFRESSSSGAFNPGALYLKGSGSTLVENNHFHGNVGDRAGAVFVREMTITPTLRNNTFADNVTTEEAGAGGTIRILESSAGLALDALLLNNAFVGDVRGISYLTSASSLPTLDVRNDSFSGQSAGVTTLHTTVAQLNAESWASGNIAADPGIADPTVSPRISPGSPVAGQALGAEAPEDDFFGLPRPSPSGFAVGASEPREPCESPQTLELKEETLTAEEVFEACREIITGPDLEIASPGKITLRAGERVALGNGTRVGAGATLVVTIVPALAVY